ncbi:MAG: hypothetical protein K9K64_10360, partial [Desulfohalobiaceae bacterium]|nr:hypothetical protein [Desulfohalobiaceae bacterium]
MIPKTRSSMVFIGLVLVFSMLLAIGPVTAAEKKIRWKGQTCFGINSPLGKHTIVLWKDFVEE